MNARSPWALALPCIVAAALAVTVSARPTTADTPKSIFVAALDEQGRPVKDLATADFALREDGQDRQITEVIHASTPLQVMLLIDTSDATREITRDIRAATGAFVQQALSNSPETLISIMEFGQAAVPVVPFTSSKEELEKGITKLIGKPSAPSVLMEALIESCNQLAKRENRRRAIVSLNMEPANEQSREDPKAMQEAFRKSGASMWSVSLQRNVSTTATSSAGSTRSAPQNANRDVLLNEMAKRSGGRRDFIVAQSALETYMKAYADALSFQYEVKYNRPGKSAQVVQVGTTRMGVKLHASGFAPQ